MVTVATNNLTILDATKMMTEDGKMLAIAELLSKRTGLPADMEWHESDRAEGHMIAQETTLPTMYTKVANSGTTPSKGTVAQVLESPETIDGWMVLDDDVANYGGNPPAKIAQQMGQFARSAAITKENRLVYGNHLTTPGQIQGILQRYNSLSGNVAENVINAGGVGSDNSSILLVVHGPGFYGFYPKGSKAGMDIEDFGRQARTIDSTEQVVYRSRVRCAFGIALADWRQLVRICNIDISLLVAGTGADLPKFMNRATEVVNDLSDGRPSFYMNRTVKMMLAEQARDDVKGGGGLQYEVVDGKRIDMWRGIPITVIDTLTEAEAAVS